MKNNMEINNDVLEWEAISCFENRIELKLPKEWRKPTKKEAYQCFPYDLKPQEIFVCQEKGKIVTINLLEKQLKKEQVYPAISEMQRTILHVYPESVQQSAKKIVTKAGTAGWFSFETGGLKHDNYHIMFILSVLEKMVMGSYHFPKKDVKNEIKFFLQLLRGIKVIKDDAEVS